MAKKPIVIGGFTKEQREKELEKIKAKYEKKGYKYLSYEDNGAIKSVAIFEVDQAILRKEKSKQLIAIGIGFLIISAILFIKATNAEKENQTTNTNSTTKEAIKY